MPRIRLKPKKRLFAEKVNKTADRIAKNKADFNAHRRPKNTLDVFNLTALRKQIEHDTKILRKAKAERTRGVKGVVRALVSRKAMRRLRESREEREAADWKYATSQAALERLKKLQEKEIVGALTQNEAKQLFQLEISRPRYERMIKIYENAQKRVRKRAKAA